MLNEVINSKEITRIIGKIREDTMIFFVKCSNKHFRLTPPKGEKIKI